MRSNTIDPLPPLSEVESLRARLAEAEDTLRAIRAGEIDAMVVSTAQGSQVFTLQGADQNYRVILETMNEGAVTLDSSGTVLFANPRFSSMVETPMQKVVGTHFEQFVAEADRLAFRGFFQEGLQTSSKNEVRLCASNGTFLAAVLSFSPLAFDTPSVCVIVEDISQIKRAAETLQQSETTLRAWLNAIQESALLIDREGIILAANATARQRLQRPAEELVGASYYDLLPEPTAATRRLHIARVIEEGQLQRFEDERSGRIIDNVFYPVVDQAGQVKSVAILGTDITEQKMAEDTIRHFAERLGVINNLDHIISSSLDIDAVFAAFVPEMKKLIPFQRTAIVMLDPSGENWQITQQWTEGKAAFVPYAWHPVKDSAVEWVITHQKAFLESALGELSAWPEHHGLRQEGIQARALLPLIIQNKVIGILSFASQQARAYGEDELDMLQTLADQVAIAIQNARLYKQARFTAEELEQRVRIRTAQVEKANKDLEAFSYSVSHDLRAPLRAIGGFAQILASENRNELDEAGQHYLDRVIESSNRMGLLIENLLLYARLGRAGIQFQSISIEDLLKNVLHDLEVHRTDTQATVHLPAPGAIPRITSDPTLLSQIFGNLIDNALTYHRPGIPPEIEIRYRTENDGHLFGICDNGIGIAAEYFEKIFNVFQRLHPVDQYHGTGIGLAIVKKAVDLLGGQVWVEAVPGQGSTFWFKLPQEGTA